MAQPRKTTRKQLPAIRNNTGPSKQVPDLTVVVRGLPVILAHELADFYSTTTNAVNHYRRRNEDRFTNNYAFQLTLDEWENLKSQDVMSHRSHGGRRIRPWAYTEHGVAMLSMGMKNEDAVRLSKVIIETFVKFRRGELQNGSSLLGPEQRRSAVSYKRRYRNRWNRFWIAVCCQTLTSLYAKSWEALQPTKWGA